MDVGDLHGRHVDRSIVQIRIKGLWIAETGENNIEDNLLHSATPGQSTLLSNNARFVLVPSSLGCHEPRLSSESCTFPVDEPHARDTQYTQPTQYTNTSVYT